MNQCRNPKRGASAVGASSALPTRRVALGALAKVGLLGAVGVAPACQQVSAAAQRQRVTFGLIGDTPYGNADERNLSRILTRAATEAQFMIHVGDFKGGSERCDETLLQRRIKILNESPRPLIVVPGDNEWVDCSRRSAGGFDPVERLAVLRRLLYQNRPHLGTGKLAVERPDPANQTTETPHMPHPIAQPEYMRWQAGPCLFVTLNIPGSRNALQPDIAPDSNERRATRNGHWLLDSANVAKQRGLAGLVISLHGEINLHRTDLSDFAAGVMQPKNPYGWVRALLVQVAAQFPGKTLLLYGDRHRFNVDYPLREFVASLPDKPRWGVAAQLIRERLFRFERIQSFGSPWSAQYVIVRAWTERNSNELKTLVATRAI